MIGHLSLGLPVSQQLIESDGSHTAGYFKETMRVNEKIQTPFVDDSKGRDRQRNLSTTIYYLLTPDGPDNFVHMNLSTVRLIH